MYTMPGLDYFITPPEPVDEEQAVKLILCPYCDDVVRLIPGAVRWCSCGECGGKYLEDELHAVITQGAVPIGFDNRDLAPAAIAYLHGRITESVRYFVAFVIHCDSERVQVVDKGELE